MHIQGARDSESVESLEHDVIASPISVPPFFQSQVPPTKRFPSALSFETTLITATCGMYPSMSVSIKLKTRLNLGSAVKPLCIWGRYENSMVDSLILKGVSKDPTLILMKHRSEQLKKMLPAYFLVWFRSSAALPCQRFTQPLNLWTPSVLRRATFCPEHDWCRSPSLAFHLSHLHKTMWPNSSNPCHFWRTFHLKGRITPSMLYLYPPSMARDMFRSCPFENESFPTINANI